MKNGILKIILAFSIYHLAFSIIHAQGMMPGPGMAHTVSSGAVFVEEHAQSSIFPGTILTLSSPVATGNSVIAVFTIPDTKTVVDCKFNDGGLETLTRAITVTVAGTRTEIWYETNVTTGGTQVSCNFGGGFPISSWYNLTEWSGLKAAGPENTNTNTALTSSTVTTNSVTPISAHNLIISGGGWTANNYSSGPINSFTRLTGGTESGNVSEEIAYKIQSSATVNSTGWGLTAPLNWDAGIVVFGAN